MVFFTAKETNQKNITVKEKDRKTERHKGRKTERQRDRNTKDRTAERQKDQKRMRIGPIQLS